MMGFSQHSQKSHEIIADVLSGVETVTEAQRKTALAMVSGALKERQVQNGHITQIISLTKLGVRDPNIREQIALTALRSLLPEGTVVMASGGVPAPSSPTLAGDTSQAATGAPSSTTDNAGTV